jgi:DNA invertase Pin-like site-specific DNA recombinase
MPGRAAIFVRSSDTEIPLRDEVARRGFRTYRRYVDLAPLMHDVRRGELAAVLVVGLNRFATSTRHLLDVLEQFRKYNVTFVSLHEHIDTSITGDFFRTIVAAIVDFEHAICRERILEGLARARRQGIRLGRRPNHSTGRPLSQEVNENVI